MHNKYAKHRPMPTPSVVKPPRPIATGPLQKPHAVGHPAIAHPGRSVAAQKGWITRRSGGH